MLCLTGPINAHTRASPRGQSIMSDGPLTQQWLRSLSTSGTSSANDEPRYWHSDPKMLLSSSNIHSFTLGTGESIYATSILPLIEAAEQEVILVTCFWARSNTLNALTDALRKLSAKGQRSGHRIRVRIYFSSSSLTQKLFHPQTLQGRTWHPLMWEAKLNLPSPDELPGLDMQAKSIFLLPFSVMHPKFVIIDRAKVLLPSCNVSWEDWFEGCVELSGEIVGQFVTFWQQFWAVDDDARTAIKRVTDEGVKSAAPTPGPNPLSSQPLSLSHSRALFLPSPHHRNPRFAYLPWQFCPSPPPTPLNTFLLEAIKAAQSSIYIQTPNLTAPPILSALLAALRRGVDVTIFTSEKLMILEQLVTAGTTTARCMRKLVKRYKRLQQGGQPASGDGALLESGIASRTGDLSISVYQPLPSGLRNTSTPEPVQSHLKLTIVDMEWTSLGSGNLDRASLFTSQELGVAFCSKQFAEVVRGEVGRLMEGRRKKVYDS